MKLYELTNDYRALMNAIDNEEIPEEAIADTLEAITGEIEVKADEIACLLKNLNADIAAFKAEETRLAERRKQKERAYERIKAYLAEELQKASVTSVDTARNKISFRKSESVYIANEAEFLEWALMNRDDLIKYGEPSPKLTEIKNAIKGGAVIEGCELRTNQNIQLK
jgi:hypothetical protein